MEIGRGAKYFLFVFDVRARGRKKGKRPTLLFPSPSFHDDIPSASYQKIAFRKKFFTLGKTPHSISSPSREGGRGRGGGEVGGKVFITATLARSPSARSCGGSGEQSKSTYSTGGGGGGVDRPSLLTLYATLLLHPLDVRGGSSPFDNGMRASVKKASTPLRRGRESNCVSAPLFGDGQTAKGTLLLLFLLLPPLFCDDDNQASRL